MKIQAQQREHGKCDLQTTVTKKMQASNREKQIEQARNEEIHRPCLAAALTLLQHILLARFSFESTRATIGQ